MKNKRKRVSSPRTSDGKRRPDKLLVCPLLRHYATRYGSDAAGVVALDAQLGKQP